MFDDEVVNGSALLVLEMPQALQTEEALRECLLQQFGSGLVNQICEIRINSQQTVSTGGSKEVAGIKFYNADAARSLIMKATVASVGRVDGYELRRGYLAVGPYKLFIEGVVSTAAPLPAAPLPVDGSCSVPGEGAGENTKAAEVVQQHVDIEDYTSVPSGNNNAHAVGAPAAAQDESRDSIVPVIMNLILLYTVQVSPKDGWRVEKSFHVHPYLVAQILRKHLIPKSIAMLPTKRNPKKKCDNYRVLLEITREDLRILREVFDGIIVELATVQPHGKSMEHISEARFRVFINEEGGFRGVMDRRRKAPGECGEVFDPIRDFPDAFIFERVWLEDAVARGDADRKRPAPAAEPPKKRSREEVRRPESLPSVNPVPSVPVSVPELSRQITGVTASQRPVNQPIPSSTLLPPGWRSVFSQEYQRVYYVYQNPSTGEERTSWTLPSTTL